MRYEVEFAKIKTTLPRQFPVQARLKNNTYTFGLDVGVKVTLTDDKSNKTDTIQMEGPPTIWLPAMLQSNMCNLRENMPSD